MRDADDIGQWALVYLGVISTLLAASSLRPWLGGNAALTIGFAVASMLVLVRRRAALAHQPHRTVPVAALAFGCGLLAGYASLRGLLSGTVGAASLLGVGSPAPPSSAVWPLAPALLAPVFEEVLYREQLYNLLRPRIGVVPTVLVTSAAFAVLHVQPWLVAGAFLAGVLLGAVVWASGSLSLCIGLHLGWNVGAFTYATRGPTFLPPTTIGVAIAIVASVVAGMVLRPAVRTECRSR